VVFQPHRYSRSKFLMDEFATAFYQSDYLLVTDIYAAGEEPIPGVDAEVLTRGIVGHGHKNAHYVSDPQDLLAQLMAVIKPGDIVITLGAGDVWKLGESLIGLLKERAEDDHGNP